MDEIAGPTRTPFFGLTRPFVVKTPKVAPDYAKAIENISRELNVGSAGIMLVETESAEEVRQGIAAMRFKSKGGTRPDAVGRPRPRTVGMSEREYRQKADLWPLNPTASLINWTIVESKEGLAHVREIAAVKGIGVLWPGAGTLRGVFSTTNAPASASATPPRGRTRFSRCCRPARNSTCRAASRQRRTTSRRG
jgi:2-keto-3-deoxy-L-rhamnonate aldolase RhmA